MANCKKGSATAADGIVNIPYVSKLNAVNGIHCTFVVRNDIAGAWKNAKDDKSYFGIVPVVGTTERYDLAFTQFDLLVENIPSFPSGNDVVFFTPQDDLHKVAREAYTNDIMLSAWLNAIVAAFPTGATLNALTYAARNKNGGTWQCAILGATKA